MIVAGIVAGLSGVGLIQALAGLVLVNRFDSLATRTAGAAEPPVTVLKPLHGGEPLLEEALASVCRQDYPSWQVVFGVHDPADSALPVVRRLQARFPACDIAVVVDPTPHGPNRKVANLINMLPAAKHDVLVIADSDVHVAAGLAESAGRGAGGAGHRPGDDGLHRLAGLAGPCGHLGALQINHYFLPGALLARAMGRQDCLGASMMLRRETLERIGGLARSGGPSRRRQRAGPAGPAPGTDGRAGRHHPGDHRAGDHVSRRCGATSCAGRAPSARWSRCRSPPRCCNIRWPGRRWPSAGRRRRPGRWPGSPPPGPSARARRAASTGRSPLPTATPLWLLPLRELMSVAVMAASFVGRRVEWRGHTLHAEGIRPAMMKTLFLHPPSFDGFDGGAGSRYQARREIRSFWYPTWLAQPAALVPGSKLIDAPPARIGLDAVTAQARDYELCVIHTSTPSFASDVKVAAALKAGEPGAEDRLRRRQGGGAARGKPAPGRADRLRGAQRVRLHGARRSPRAATGRRWTASRTATARASSCTTRTARSSRTWTSCPSSPRSTSATCASRTTSSATCCTPTCRCTPAAAANRAARSACGRRRWAGIATACARRGTWRRRSRLAQRIFPQVREFFFDDDTFTDNLPRAEAIARELGKLGVTWSCNAKANVPRETLKVLKDNGLRLLLVGYESGNQQILHNIKKGMRIEVAERFTRDCHELGIKIHGTFILGLPGETQETIEETIRFATRDQPAHHPGVAGGAVSRHVPLQPGGGERLAGCGACRTGGRARGADRAADRMSTCRTPRSSTTSRRSTGASISVRRRSPRSSARWCAARR